MSRSTEVISTRWIRESLSSNLGAQGTFNPQGGVRLVR